MSTYNKLNSDPKNDVLLPINNNDKPFYDDQMRAKEIIYDNDIGDLKRFISIRYWMFILSIISNLISSLSLSSNIVINIVQNMGNYENLGIYQIITLSIFVVSIGLNYFSNNVDTNIKTQQLKLLSKFGLESKIYNDQDALNFDRDLAKQVIKV